MTFIYPSFIQLCDKVNDKKQLSQIMQKQQCFFQINPYKIQKLYVDAAKKIYSQIIIKYQITKEFKVIQNYWQENQRRVFVWYMIIFINIYSIPASQYNQINFQKLSTIFFGKTSLFLEFQFSNLIKIKSKVIWTEEEDKILLEAMKRQKPGKWNQISKRIFYQSERSLFKSPKHCRQRWFNHLDKSKNKGVWTLQQDYLIFKFIIEKGKRWATIVKTLQNSRTQHMIKNRYNSLISKFKKNKKRRQQQIASIAFKSLQAEIKIKKKEKKMKNNQNQIYSQFEQKKQFISIDKHQINIKKQEPDAKKQEVFLEKYLQTKIQSVQMKNQNQMKTIDEPLYQYQQNYENHQNIYSLNFPSFQQIPIESYNMFYCYNNISSTPNYWSSNMLPGYIGQNFY